MPLNISKKNSICEVTIESQKVNLLNEEFLKDFTVHISQISEDESIKVIIIKSNIPDYFLGGIDEEHDYSANELDDIYKWLWRSVYAVASCKIPIISLCNGRVLAEGVSIFLASDFIISTEKTSLKLSNRESSNHIGISFLRRFLSQKTLLKISMANKEIHSKELNINKVFYSMHQTEDMMLEAANDLSQRLISKKRQSLMIAKKLINVDIGSYIKDFKSELSLSQRNKHE